MGFDPASKVLGKQLVRAATSIGANIEEAQSASSRKDFINKIYIAKKEAREANYWLRLIRDASLSDNDEIKKIIKDGDEIYYILTAITKTAENNSVKSLICNKRSDKI